jgi:tyrosyl-tRNA synthetase
MTDLTDISPFQRGTIDLIEERELTERLAAGRPLRIKFGMDPSSPDLHLGHAIPLLKLRALQQAGHQIVLIVGDATAMVGDPSGRNKLRPQLTRADVEANLVTYTEQAGCVLDLERTEVRRNSEWFDRMDFGAILKLASRMTVAQMIERDTFQKRMRAQEPIGIHEFLYPLMQGWDSVEVRADIELGGTDQLFNLLVGRDLQRGEQQRGQVCLTLPLINGLDGRKMSKSYGNAVGLTDSATDMFGKIMSLEDGVMEAWFTLLTDLDDAQREDVLAGHPRAAKARLAEEITGFFRGASAATDARAAFDSQFRDRALPTDIPEVSLGVAWPAEGIPLAVLLREIKLAPSSKEARRLVEQGAVRLSGEVVREPMLSIPAPTAPLLVQVGKRRFARVLGGT